MGYIHVLDKNVRELISAGEVVERPASVVKELVENSLDASATFIEVSLFRNGLDCIQVKDNGKGFEKDDVEVAFLRHATSKINSADDLFNIGSFGFRGEALAAISAVSKVQLVTRSKNDEIGTKYIIEGGVPVSLSDTGAPEGTLIQVRDLFYNTPARMKFLKKDIAEGNAVEQLLIHLALSNPDVSFQLNRDDKTTLKTSGQGLYNAIFELYPRDMSSNLIKVEYNSDNGILVNGYLVEPRYSRPSRSLQHLSINGRYIKNRTIQASVEEACRSFVMQGKYPVFVLDVILPLSEVDVNVHPAKTEVRFKNEREVTSAVYHAIQNAIQGTFDKADNYVFSNVISSNDNTSKQVDTHFRSNENSIIRPSNAVMQPLKKDSFRKEQVTYADTDLPFQSITNTNLKNTIKPLETETKYYSFEENLLGDQASTLRVLGEVFQTYIIAQNDTNLVIIDMHAAHERILFEELRKSNMNVESQLLLEPVIITLLPNEKQALFDNADLLSNLGFMIDEIGQKEVAVREIPTYLNMNGVETAIVEIAEQLVNSREDLTFDAKEWLLHSVACRAAIKAGHKASKEEMISLTSKIMCGSVPKYCPHGRPVYMMLSKTEIEKSFGRLT
ncbi:MAG: DNA mismatch repair endonuclease MutL [Oscillospiraceae bacterium]|nr:DNA mismatch repair endonuclease MutL [Oscillospiraceae bacterium]